MPETYRKVSKCRGLLAEMLRAHIEDGVMFRKEASMVKKETLTTIRAIIVSNTDEKEQAIMRRYGTRSSTENLCHYKVYQADIVSGDEDEDEDEDNPLDVYVVWLPSQQEQRDAVRRIMLAAEKKYEALRSRALATAISIVASREAAIAVCDSEEKLERVFPELAARGLSHLFKPIQPRGSSRW